MTDDKTKIFNLEAKIQSLKDELTTGIESLDRANKEITKLKKVKVLPNVEITLYEEVERLTLDEDFRQAMRNECTKIAAMKKDELISKILKTDYPQFIFAVDKYKIQNVQMDEYFDNTSQILKQR